MRTPANLTVTIRVDRTDSNPLHEQIADQLAEAIESGGLRPGGRLPSTRVLADLLDVSRGVALAAYDTLFARGYLEGKHGSGTFVASREGYGGPPRPVSRLTGERVPIDFRPSRPFTARFPLDAWRAAWRHASYLPPPSGGRSSLGRPELRSAVADYLTRFRGIRTAGRDVVVTAGLGHGLRLASACAVPDGRAVAIEDPCPPRLRAVVATTHPTVTLPVDENGARVEHLEPRCGAVVLHPDGGEPHGHALSAERRIRVAAWARDTGGRVIEIADERRLQQAVDRPRMLDIAGTETIVVGAFDTLFGESIHVGYVLVPTDLAPRLHELMPPWSESAANLEQMALAWLLREGQVIRRLHQFRRSCAHRADVVSAQLAGLAEASVARQLGSVIITLPDHLPAAEISSALLDHGYDIPTLAEYYANDHSANALVLGYAHVDDDQLDSALLDLRSLLAATRARRVLV